MAALRIEQVTTGALLTHQEPVYEIEKYATIYVQLTPQDPQDHPWATLIDKLTHLANTYVPKRDRVNGGWHLVDTKLPDLEISRIDGLKKRISYHSRHKRGLFDFVGNIASTLFGLPSPQDIKLLKEANNLIAHEVVGLARVQRTLVGKVNILGKGQQELVAATNELIKRQNQQTELFQVFVNKTWNHLRVMTLIDILADAIDTYSQLETKSMLARAACEARHPNEMLLPISIIKNILATGDTHHVTDSMAYYGYLKVDKITVIDNEIYCVIKAPLFSADHLQRIHIHTFPICYNDSSHCAQIYQPPPFIFNTHSEEIFFPETCYGPQPLACLPTVKYDKRTLPCHHGLYLSDPDLLKQCPVTLHKTRPPPGPIQTATLNRFIVETPRTVYHYKCPPKTPEAEELPAGTYVITIDSHCAFAANAFILTGVPNTVINYSLPELKSLPLLGLDFSQPIYPALLNNLPASMSQLSIPSTDDISLPDPSDLINDIDKIQAKLSVNRLPWWLWLILAILVVLTMFFLYVYLHSKYKCTFGQTKELIKPTTYDATTSEVKLGLENQEPENKSQNTAV